jgi:hypothetical protein
MSDSKDPEAEVIARALKDPAFRKKLIADPTGTLRTAGVEVPEGVSVQVLEESPTRVYLVLPAPVDENEMIESDLEEVTGGVAESRCKPSCNLSAVCGATR